MKTRSNVAKIDFDEIPIAGCKNLSVWSLHYLAQAKDKQKTLLSLVDAKVSAKERVAGCDLISDEMAVSLGPRDPLFKLECIHFFYKYTILNLRVINLKF